MGHIISDAEVEAYQRLINAGMNPLLKSNLERAFEEEILRRELNDTFDAQAELQRMMEEDMARNPAVVKAAIVDALATQGFETWPFSEDYGLAHQERKEDEDLTP